MANNDDNLFTRGARGAVGKQFVYKRINGKSVLCKFPDMTNVEYNRFQKSYQQVFAEAVKYAQSINNDPVKHHKYSRKIHNDKRKRGTSVYHTALKEFMTLHSKKVDEQTVKAILQKYLETYHLSDRAEKAIEYLIRQGSITNALYRNLTNVSRITATRDLKMLAGQGIITAPEIKGAGAVYMLASSS